MSFFNQKEEVLELKLTPHGRYRLSQGKLDPTYYAFFDDDVTYDIAYTTIGYIGPDFPSGAPPTPEFSITDSATLLTGALEVQDNIEERIENKTPRLHTQHTFRERKVNLVEYTDTGYLQNTHEREHGLVAPLGNCDVQNNFAPAWDTKLHKGTLTSSLPHYTGSGPTYPIPQLECNDLQYGLVLGNFVKGKTGPDPTFPDSERIVRMFGDTSILEIREESLFIEVNEANVPHGKENFEIELFEVIEETDRAGNITETLNPIYFGQTEIIPKTDEMAHYLDITTDSNIDLTTLCRYKGEDSTENTFLPPIFDCRRLGEDILSEEGIGQYQTSVTAENIGNVCSEES